MAHRRGIFCPSPNLFQKHMFLTCDFLSKPMNFPMISFATRCRLHVDSRANRCDQKLNLPIPVSKVSCHLANKMSANVWHTSYVDQYDTTCCGHDYNQVEPSGTKTGSKPLCLDFWDGTFLQPSGTEWNRVRNRATCLDFWPKPSPHRLLL